MNIMINASPKNSHKQDKTIKNANVIDLNNKYIAIISFIIIIDPDLTESRNNSNTSKHTTFNTNKLFHNILSNT